MVISSISLLLLVLSIIQTCVGGCVTTPLQHDVSEFKTIRYFCEYEHYDKMQGVTKVRIGQGSVFELIDACHRCRCTSRGLECCDIGLRVDIPSEAIPIECHIRHNGCDQYLVLKSDNTTDCATGRPALQVQQEQEERYRKRQYVKELIYNHAMDAAELNSGANAEQEEKPLQPWVLMDYFLNDAYVGRIPSQVIENQTPPQVTDIPPRKTNMADANIDAAGKDLVNNLGGPDVARSELMERIKMANIDNIQRQRSTNGNLGLLYLLTTILS